METRTQMKPQYVKAIVDNPALLGAIAQKTNKSISTVERWCAQNHESLTMISAIQCVREFLKLDKSVSITETVNELKAA